MRKMLVFKDLNYGLLAGGGTIATINQVGLLADGACAIFTNDGTFVTAATAAALLAAVTPLNLTRQGYIIYQGVPATTGTTVKRSMVIPFGSKYSLRAYVAPVAQVVLIGDDGAGIGDMNFPTLVVGETAHIRIQNMSAGTLPAIEIYRVESTVNASSTATSVINDLVVRINNHPQLSQLVTAVATVTGPLSVGISLTVIPVDTQISVGVSGIATDATIDETLNAVTVAVVFGSGTYSDVVTIWQEYSTELGNTSQDCLANQMFSFANPAVVGETYDMYGIQFRKDRDNNTGGSADTDDMIVELVIPNAPANTVQTAVNAILQIFD
jgi:hypothetical protein